MLNLFLRVRKSRILPFRSSIILFAFDTVPSACFPSGQAPSHLSRLSLLRIPFSSRTISRCDPKGFVVEAPRIGSRVPRVSSSTTANPTTPPMNEQQEVLAIPRFERLFQSRKVLSQLGLKFTRRESHANPGRNLQQSCEISVCRVPLEYDCRENVLIITPLTR